MKILAILQQLFILAYSCLEFWKKWDGYPCLDPVRNYNETSQLRCYKTEKNSFVQLSDDLLTMVCNDESLNSQLVRCLDANNLKTVYVQDCPVSDLDLQQFASHNSITWVVLNYTREENNFHSLILSHWPGLQKISLWGLRTSEVLNVTLEELPRVQVLEVVDHNFTSFLERPWAALPDLVDLKLKKGVIRLLPDDLFYGLDRLQTLYLNENHIEELSASLFSQLSELKSLDLADNRIAVLPDSLLSNLTKLESIFLQRNSLSSFPPNLLRSCRNLNYFYGDDNPVGSFPTGFLGGLVNLSYFSAINCSLTHLPDDFFSDTSLLRGVFLTYNRLKYLTADLFTNNKHLTSLYLSVNKLSLLPSGIFDGLSQLEDLHLGVNELLEISPEAFQHLTSLKLLDLAFNYITHLSEETFRPLVSLQILKLDNNRLERISGDRPLGQGQNLSRITAKKTRLKEWPNIDWSSKALTYVDLSGNLFQEVTLPVFTGNRVNVLLSDNQIHTVYVDTHRHGPDFPIYDTRGNPVTCDCRLRQFLIFLHSRAETANEIFPYIRQTDCHGQQRRLTDVWPIDELCRVEKDCPATCRCFRYPDEAAVDCSGQNMTEVPPLLPWNATVVDLSRNGIGRLSGTEGKRWGRVTRLHLSHNSLASVGDGDIPSSVTYLALEGNLLTGLPPSLLDRIDGLPDFRIRLSGNNWTCGCSHSSFPRRWLLANVMKIGDLVNLTCHWGTDTVPLVRFVASTGCQNTDGYSFSGWKVALLCVSLALCVVAVAALVVYRRKRTLKKEISVSIDRLSFSPSHRTS